MMIWVLRHPKYKNYSYSCTWIYSRTQVCCYSSRRVWFCQNIHIPK